MGSLSLLHVAQPDPFRFGLRTGFNVRGDFNKAKTKKHKGNCKADKRVYCTPQGSVIQGSVPFFELPCVFVGKVHHLNVEKVNKELQALTVSEGDCAAAFPDWLCETDKANLWGTFINRELVRVLDTRPSFALWLFPWLVGIGQEAFGDSGPVLLEGFGCILLAVTMTHCAAPPCISQSLALVPVELL